MSSSPSSPVSAGPGRWRLFWDGQAIFPESFWLKNAELLLEGLDQVLPLNPDMRVLEIGCAQGRLLDGLSKRVAHVHGVDTSPRAIAVSRERVKGRANVTVDLLGDDYTSLRFAGSEAFDLVVCNSVIQYYADRDEVLRLVDEVMRVLRPGGFFLLSDLVVSGGSWGDAWSLLRTASREGLMLDAFFFLLRARASDYHSLRSDPGLLTFDAASAQALIAAIEARGGAAQALEQRLTLNDDRLHLLVTFDSRDRRSDGAALSPARP